MNVRTCDSPLPSMVIMKNFFLISIALIAFLLPLVFAQAAEIRFVATPSVAPLGGEVAVDVMLDTLSKTVTAVSGKIVITGVDGEKVPVARIRDGDSILGAWLTQGATDKPGEVSFSGIIPSGGITARGKILTLYIIPKKIGTLTFLFSGTAYFDTAPGESVPFTRKSFVLSVRESLEQAATSTPPDNTPPEDIRGIIAQNEGMFDGKPFIIVHAKDRESGILVYEVLEGAQFYPPEVLARDARLPWRRIENPALLLYPINTGYIYVRVTDREGNSAVALVRGPNELSPEKSTTSFKTWLILAILIGVAGASLWLWARRRNNHA